MKITFSMIISSPTLLSDDENELDGRFSKLLKLNIVVEDSKDELAKPDDEVEGLTVVDVPEVVITELEEEPAWDADDVELEEEVAWDDEDEEDEEEDDADDELEEDDDDVDELTELPPADIVAEVPPWVLIAVELPPWVVWVAVEIVVGWTIFVVVVWTATVVVVVVFDE